ncbi:hypothetical protein [Roseateles oligotrophus]|uniref:DUF541 domain-containing protein n=1 Tax=Roseateles oligotrophus TaxID=1769250 RepID=A0ABT2YB46_9BURK|nr:hypothetical protein [Roseateles oligotrophus]MCV2367528.1 hypothetical protein [Roseateles oligotrophus]
MPTVIFTPIPRTFRLAMLLLMSLTAAVSVAATAAVRRSWLKVEAEVNGPFAEKHLTLTIRNRSTIALEAALKLPLAAIERLRDAVAVASDRVQARLAFEETQRKRVDPALMERGVGSGHFRVDTLLSGQSLVPRLAEKSGRVLVCSFDIGADGARTVAP